MQRVLFVDDDAKIHHSINRLLRKKPVNWDYIFAQGVDEALSIMENTAVEAMIEQCLDAFVQVHIQYVDNRASS